MAIGATLNAIDISRTTIITKRDEVATRRSDIQTERQSISTNMDQLEIDLKAANISGVGTLSAGFLDGYPAGTIQQIELENTNRYMTFDYDVDSDTISNIQYKLKASNNNNYGL